MPNKVKVGFFSFTEILGGEHRGYNEWHLLDHMPEQFKLDGMVWGQRWVSPPALASQRYSTHDGLSKSHYMTLYLMAEPVDRTLAEFQELGGTLRSLGRFFPHDVPPASLRWQRCATTSPCRRRRYIAGWWSAW